MQTIISGILLLVIFIIVYRINKSNKKERSKMTPLQAYEHDEKIKNEIRIW